MGSCPSCAGVYSERQAKTRCDVTAPSIQSDEKAAFGGLGCMRKGS